jgi:predicted KAP-like P-loop ATPase
MKSMANKVKHKFASDRPIESRKDDLLGVAGFAESLASAISGWKGKDSLVIALYGHWGSGKSSIKNIAIETLRADQTRCPLIVEFNPWQWAGQEQLAQSFFHEIGIALRKTEEGKSDKKRAAKWRHYAAYLKVGSFIAGSFNRLVIGLLVLTGIIGIGGVVSNVQWVNAVIVFISIAALIFAGLFKWSGSFAEKLAAFFETRYEAAVDGIADVKKKLSEALSDLKTPVVVTIDDVDRLSANEIKYLFQLVKANADFPNMVYLLLFQRDIVEKSLEDISPITGREFIEKIVQVGFDIPRIERSRIEKVLFSGLDELLSEKVIEKRFDQHRWGNIFVPGLRPYFETLRDVHRFLSTLSFHISLFRNKGSFDVNSTDLIALEVLRVFEPVLYQRIFEVKHILTQQHDSSTENDHRQAIEAIMNLVPESRRQSAQEIVKQLFPRAEWVFGGYNFGSDFDEQWYRDLRVCHPNVFDRYFHFAISEGDLSQAEIDKILSLVGNRTELVTELRSLNRRNLLAVALDRLEAYKQQIPIQDSTPFISALMDIGDELPENPPGFSFNIRSDWQIGRIIYWFLMQESDIKKRGQLLKEALILSTSLYLPIMRVSLEESKYEKQDEQDSYLVDRDDFEELKKLCVERIRKAGSSESLKNHPEMLRILYHWLKWAPPDEIKKWVADLIQTNEGLLSFLTKIVHSSVFQSGGDYVSRTHWRISIKNVEDFISPEVIAQKVKALNTENLSEKEQRAVKAFQKAMKRRREGKSDDDWRYDDDE